MKSPQIEIEVAPEPMLAQYQRLDDAPRTAAYQDIFQKGVDGHDRILDLCSDAGLVSTLAAKRVSKVICLTQSKEDSEKLRRLIDFNSSSNKIEVVVGDFTEYVPREYVNVVICDFVRVGLFNSPQTLLVESLRKRFTKSFPQNPMPTLLPAATVLALQPLQYNFNFSGYLAPVPIFQAVEVAPLDGIALAEPTVYHGVDYNDVLPEVIEWEGEITIQNPGTVNAVRVITKNVAGALEKEDRVFEWFMPHLVVPITQPLVVAKGDKVKLHLVYRPGDSVEVFQSSLTVARA